MLLNNTMRMRRSLQKGWNFSLTDRINADGVLESVPGAPFAHNFNSWETYSPAGQANLLDQAFYLWAVVAAAAATRRSKDPALNGYLAHAWPRVPSHWLWVP